MAGDATRTFGGSRDGLPVEHALLLEQVCDRFEARWRAGERPDLAAALRDLPEAIRPAARREFVALEMYYRNRLGESPVAADYPDLDPDWLTGLTASFHAARRGGTATGEAPASLPGGTVVGYFGDYELLGEIARGGMGIVYRARQISLDRAVALKMIRSGELAGPGEARRFRREVEAVAALDHPHIVPIYEVGEHAGRRYYTMRLLEGGSLAGRIADFAATAADGRAEARRRQTASAALLVLNARAVHHAHQRGILHRDLKPSNILLDGMGEPHVVDFGLARRIGSASSLTATGAVLGTPSYMSPEQARGGADVTTQVDVYGLGAVLYELLTGLPPFKGVDALDTVAQVREREVTRPRTVCGLIDRDLETICLKCLAKDPARRYDSASALADDLDRWGRGDAILARRVGRLELARKWARRNPAVAGLVAVSALFLLAAVGGSVAFGYSRTLEGKNRDLAAAKDDAEEQRSTAVEQREEANRQRERARAEEIRARRYLYISRMTLAQQAERDNRPDRVVQLLRSVIPEHPGREDVRGFEWHHLWRKYQGEQSTLRGHTGEVTGVAFSDTGLLIASSSADGILRIWDALGGKNNRTLSGHDGRVNGIAFGREGKMLLSGGQDGTWRIWDPSTGQQLKSVSHGEAIAAVAFSPDGTSIACGSATKVTLYNVDSGESELVQKHSHPVTGVSFSHDGLSLASVTFRPQNYTGVGYASIWLRSSGKERGRLPRNDGRLGVAYSPDGSKIATSDAINGKFTVSIYDVTTGKIVHTLSGLENMATQVAFDPSGKFLAAGGRDRTVRVWEVVTGKALRTHFGESAIIAVAWSPDGTRIVAGGEDGILRVWSPPGEAVRSVRANKIVRSVTFSPDGRRLAVSCTVPACVFDTFTGEKKTTLEDVGKYARFAWSPDGKRIGPTNRFGFWDAVSGDISLPLAPVSAGNDVVCEGAGTAFSPNGRLFATVTGPTSVHVWDTLDGHIVHHYNVSDKLRSWRENWPVALAFHPEGKHLAIATGSDNWLRPGTLQVLDVVSGIIVREFAGYLNCVFSVAYSPDGKLLAAAVGDVWSIAKAGPSEIRLWDAATGREVLKLRGHTNSIYSIGFNVDGSRLVSGGNQYHGNAPGEVRVWDISTGEQLFALIGKSGDATAVAFSPCNRFLASGGQDGKVSILDGTPSAETPMYRPLPEEH